MPIIPLTPTQRLISTPRTWEWQHLKTRKHRRTGELVDEWEFYRNYTTLESALNDVASVSIRVAKHQDILTAIQEVKNLMASVGKALAHPIDEEIVAICRKVEGTS